MCSWTIRHHLVVDSRLRLADGYGERTAAQQMMAALSGEHLGTISADKGYDTRGLVRLLKKSSRTVTFLPARRVAAKVLHQRHHHVQLTHSPNPSL